MKGLWFTPDQGMVVGVSGIQQDIKLFRDHHGWNLDSQLMASLNPDTTPRLAGTDILEASDFQKPRPVSKVYLGPDVIARQLVFVEVNQYLQAGKREMLGCVQHGDANRIPAPANIAPM